MFFLIILYVTPKLFTLYSIWFFTIDIPYTIHLLINSFLILEKPSVDIILFHSLLIYLYSFGLFAWSRCFIFSIAVLIPFSLCYTFFQVPHIFLTSLSLHFGEDVYVFPNFIDFFIFIYHQGSDSF